MADQCCRAADFLTNLNTRLEGVTTVPGDPDRYGPWAAKILAGAPQQGIIYAIDLQGNNTPYQLDVNPTDLRLIPAHENFYGIDASGGKLWGAPAAAFTGMIGDLLVAQSSPGTLSRVRWNGADFDVSQLAQAAQWKQITFSPAGVAEISAVRQMYDKIAVIRHAPVLNSGRVEGALWQLSGEQVTLDGTDVITSDLLVPGSPTVNVSESPSFGGTVEGPDDQQPTNYQITITGNATLRHLITRTNPIQLEPIAAPPAPAGTRDVSLQQADESAGDWATVRNLTLGGRAGAVIVPPGTYGRFAASSRTAFIFGVAGSTEPTVYNLESLALTGGSELRLAGPVTLTVKSGVTLTGSTVGAANDPRRMLLKMSEGELKISGSGVLYGIVRAPQSLITIEGNGRLRGTVSCDRLTVSGNGVLQITENDIPPPPVNRPSTVDAGGDQTITLPTDTVSLQGAASDDGLPQGSTLSLAWSKVSGPGTVSFSNPASLATTATFTQAGVYVLRLTASDSLLTSSDDVTINVIQRNQPPTVSAGSDQTITLPDGANLSGAVSDDALPSGSTVAISWSMTSGDGPVTFGDPAAAMTTASFSVAGTYTLRLTASDTEFTVSDEVVITVQPANLPPTVSAGTFQTIKLPAGANLTATVSDDGLPAGSTLTTLWSKAGGPGTVTFTNADAANTTASFSADGTYALRLTVSDTQFTVSDDVTIIVETSNQPPAVNAGPDQTIELLNLAPVGVTVNLNGTASDDGLPAGSTLTTSWSKASGPGPVTFSNLNAPTTTATITEPGTYVLRLAATDSQLNNGDEVTIRLNVLEQAKYVGPTHYLSAADSPLSNLDFTYFHLEDFEDHLLNVPGVSANSGGVTSVVFGPSIHDSVDGDDGTIDGSGLAGDSYFRSSGSAGITFSFNATVLGALPTHVGIVWTDGSGQVSFEAFDRHGVSMGIRGPFALPDGSVNGTTGEDHFFGAFHKDGISAIKISNTFGGIEVDHLQYCHAPNSGFNAPPSVKAGPDQTILLANAANLSGIVNDDGLPAGSILTTTWSKVSGPGVVTFGNPNAAVTSALFSESGTYVLRLTASDSRLSRTDDLTITVNPTPSLSGASLVLAPGSAGPYTTGTTQTVLATLKSSGGQPLFGFGIDFSVTGPNATAVTAVANASGVAALTYTGFHPGLDTVKASVQYDGVLVNSNAVTMEWNASPSPSPTPPPAAIPGWVGGPINGSTVAGTVPITVGAGVTLTQGTVEYFPASNPSNVTVLTTAAAGGPGAIVATLDTTLLANGSYFVRLRGTDAAGQQLTSQVLIVVAGENKPGRMTLTVTDLIVPLAGLPIQIGRRYDSLERGVVSDFGRGWSLTAGSPRLEVNQAKDVTFTDPVTGRRVTFRFTPRSIGFPLNWGHVPVYTPEPGVHGTLLSDGCGLLVNAGGSFTCFISGTYQPTTYAYTDPAGRVFTMTADGRLRSIKALNGETLTFTSTGVTSSAGGLTVAFTRDAQGRITEVRDPAGKVFRYSYDAAGDLISVTLPDTPTPVTYTYDASHLLLKAVDARGNPAATATYYSDGRLESVTDALGQTTRYAYDLLANTTTVTNPDGGVETERYDANGLLLSETNALGQTTAYTYDAQRNRLTEKNALDQTTTYTYDGKGNLTSTTDTSGRTSGATYNEVGLPVTTTDALGHTRTISYDAQFNPVGIRDSLGNLTLLTVDGRGDPLTVTDGNGAVTRFTYDSNSNKLSETDPLGRTTSYTYDALGRVLSVTDPRGGVTRHSYDAFGRLLTATNALDEVTRYEYDANGNRTATVDALNRRTVYTYDAANRLTQATFPDSTSTSYTYDFRDQKLSETDQAGRTTRFEYDPAGRLVKTIYADNAEVVTSYDAIGRVIATTDERGQTTRYEYDPACGCQDRVTKITDALGRVTRYEFDAVGRTVAFLDANNRETRFSYDARHRMTKVSYPDGTSVRQSYDGASRVLTRTDQAGRVTTYGYDVAGGLLTVTDALGQTTRYGYDAAGNLTSQTDALGRTTSFEYDALSRKTKRVLPVGQSESYAFDAVGNLSTRTSFSGKRTTYAYDALNRLLSKTPDPTLAEPVVSFTYTKTGRRATMTDASGVTTYGYDARNRLTSKQTPQGTLTYTYDAANNLRTLRSSNANGVSVDYDYDALNRLQTVVDNQLGTTSYTYDPVGNLQTDMRPNGVRSTYNYNSTNRLTDLTIGKTTTTLNSYDYTLDPTGRRLSATERSGRSVTYAYDEIYRLINESITGDANPAANGTITYGYDAVGNRQSRTSNIAAVPSQTFNYDANDRLSVDTYDANGNTLTSSGSTFTYDFENRIKSVNGGAVTIVYDGDGNRVAKTVGGVTTRYLVDDLNPTGFAQVVEEIVGGQVQRQYTYGNTLISQNQLIGGVWTASFYGFDGHGSVRMLTDKDGVVTDTFDYDAFGNLISRQGSTPNNYLYSGEQFDPDLGIYFQRARYYNQERGRFLSMDPFAGFIDEPDSLHKYLYVGNDPVNLIDPSGMAEFAEFSQRVKQQVRDTIVYMRKHGRDILCKTLNTASIILSIPGAVSGLADLVQKAVEFGLAFCPCSFSKAAPKPPSNPRVTYRGDLFERSPDKVFKEGFSPKGENTDLLAHAYDSSGSFYVATSRSREVAEGFAERPNGWVYEISSRRGIDVNKTLGSKSPYPWEMEVAFFGGISPGEIVGAFPTKCGKISGDFIPNPNFLGAL